MLKIYRSLRTSKITQHFGENIPCVLLDQNKNPIRPFIVREFSKNSEDFCLSGWSKFYEAINMLGHNGIDWLAYRGEPIYFNVVNDKLEKIKGICKTEIDADGGKGVDVIFEDSEKFYKIRYWHLKEQLVHDGQEIMSGDLIGYADSTGASSGDHSHEGFKPLNKDGSNKYQNNGYFGAVDPANYQDVEFYPDDFILDILNLKQQLTLSEKVIQLLNELMFLLNGRK
ncbi:MAG: M23 family metallopeptidase [Methanogenium sp.]|jgi:hypothetical protein